MDVRGGQSSKACGREVVVEWKVCCWRRRVPLWKIVCMAFVSFVFKVVFRSGE